MSSRLILESANNRSDIPTGVSRVNDRIRFVGMGGLTFQVHQVNNTAYVIADSEPIFQIPPKICPPPPVCPECPPVLQSLQVTDVLPLPDGGYQLHISGEPLAEVSIDDGTMMQSLGTLDLDGLLEVDVPFITENTSYQLTQTLNGANSSTSLLIRSCIASLPTPSVTGISQVCDGEATVTIQGLPNTDPSVESVISISGPGLGDNFSPDENGLIEVIFSCAGQYAISQIKRIPGFSVTQSSSLLFNLAYCGAQEDCLILSAPIVEDNNRDSIDLTPIYWYANGGGILVTLVSPPSNETMTNIRYTVQVDGGDTQVHEIDSLGTYSIGAPYYGGAINVQVDLPEGVGIDQGYEILFDMNGDIGDSHYKIPGDVNIGYTNNGYGGGDNGGSAGE